MQEPEILPESVEPAEGRRGRRMLLLLALVALLPALVAGYLFVTDWRPSGKSIQYGELLTAARVGRNWDAGGQTVQLAALRSCWLPLTWARGSCT
jgi:hypothetical protein